MTIKTANPSDLSPAFDPSASVFVSANAGAGKTSLLSGRVLRLLLHGVEPAKILCLTFTKAAAGEMANRVLDELGAWVMADAQKLESSLQKLLGHAPSETILTRARTLFAKVLEAPEGLRIQTIHGFCQSLLKRFPIESGVSPHFNVMDSRTEQELLAEARLRLFNHASLGEGELQRSLHTLAYTLNETSFNGLISEIITNKRKFRMLLQKVGTLEAAIEDLWAALGMSPATTPDALAEQYLSCSDELVAALRGCAAALMLDGSKTNLQTGEALAAWLEKRDDAQAYAQSYFTQKGTPRKTLATKAIPPAMQELLLAEQARAGEYLNALAALNVGRHSADVLRVGDALLHLYEDIKRNHARMDYDDLILTANDLLKRSGVAGWVLFKLDGGIDHILVDEAQDTSAEQWSIIDALTQEFFAGSGRKTIERSLFVVGDEKQSIYSFQGADPSALGRMQAYFQSRIKDAAMTVNTLELARSFRSTHEVLAVVDAVFQQDAASNGLMFSAQPIRHITTKDYGGMVELWPLVQPEGEGEFIRSAATMLARTIADTIADWLSQGVHIPSQNRAIRAGDIMVLVRSRTAFVDKLTRALKRRNVPVAGRDRMELAENLAVQDLIALGQCLLLPEDDLTMAALLRSPIFALGEEQLFALCWQRGKHSVWERLKTLSGEDAAIAQALELLEDLRARADFVAPYELYSYLLETRGARARFTGRMGEEYNDPIDEFLSQALVYEGEHIASLQGFIHWLTNSKSEIKRDMEQAHNSVRIMTVHAAKGLQAPVVILPDTTSLPTLRESVLWHEGLPLRPFSVNELGMLCARLREDQRAAMLAEYRRLLYVALTRAADRLYVCGALSRGQEPNEESWYHHVRQGMYPIAERFDMAGGQALRVGKPPLRVQVASSEMPAPIKADFSFLTRPAPHEPTPPQPLAPSRLEQGEPAPASPLKDNALFQRGNVIHALLQHLPNITPDKREMAGRRLARARGALLSEAELGECLQQTLAVIHDARFAHLFAEGSYAEVPLTGCVEWQGKTIAVSGQIDRLAVTESEIWIVDYKSHRLPPATVPAAYITQMGLYRQVLEAIYPGRKVRCALLWTSVPSITMLDAIRP